jgi:hypothetical protein
MSANRTSRSTAVVWRLALAIGLLAPAVSRAEVGVAMMPASPGPRIVYILGVIDEGPTPITQVVWRPAGPGRSDRIVLNPQGEANGDGAPTVLSDPATGLVAAAWARNSASGFDVVISRFTAGAWTEAQVVAGSPSDELDPQLVLDPDGSVHLFYWVEGTTRQVFRVTAPPDLSSWSAPSLVSQPGESACRPAGAFYNGILHVAYEVHNFGNGNSPRQVVLARLDSGVFTPEVIAMTNNLGDVYPQVHSHAGRLWVDWVDAETSEGSGEIAWTRMNAQGQWEPIHFDAFASYVEREYKVRSGVRVEVIQ